MWVTKVQDSRWPLALQPLELHWPGLHWPWPLELLCCQLAFPFLLQALWVCDYPLHNSLWLLPKCRRTQTPQVPWLQTLELPSAFRQLLPHASTASCVFFRHLIPFPHGLQASSGPSSLACHTRVTASTAAQASTVVATSTHSQLTVCSSLSQAVHPLCSLPSCATQW